MDKDRKLIIDRRAKGRAAATGKDKGKYTEENAAAAMETAWTCRDINFMFTCGQ